MERSLPVAKLSSRFTITIRRSIRQRKTEQYFANDVRQVWWVNPDTRKVTVYRGPKQVEIFGDEDELTAMDVHPALRFPVSKLFE